MFGPSESGRDEERKVRMEVGRELVQSLIIYGRPPRPAPSRCSGSVRSFSLIPYFSKLPTQLSRSTMHFYRPGRKPGRAPFPLPSPASSSSWHNGNRRLTLQFLLLLLWLLGSWPCSSGCGNNCLPRAALSMGNLTRPRETERDRARGTQGGPCVSALLVPGPSPLQCLTPSPVAHRSSLVAWQLS